MDIAIMRAELLSLGVPLVSMTRWMVWLQILRMQTLIRVSLDRRYSFHGVIVYSHWSLTMQQSWISVQCCITFHSDTLICYTTVCTRRIPSRRFHTLASCLPPSYANANLLCSRNSTRGQLSIWPAWNLSWAKWKFPSRLVSTTGVCQRFICYGVTLWYVLSTYWFGVTANTT